MVKEQVHSPRLLANRTQLGCKSTHVSQCYRAYSECSTGSQISPSGRFTIQRHSGSPCGVFDPDLECDAGQKGDIGFSPGHRFFRRRIPIHNSNSFCYPLWCSTTTVIGIVNPQLDANEFRDSGSFEKFHEFV